MGTIAPMTISPEELRDIAIKDSFRGYDREEVDTLLERAAGAIEELEQRLADQEARAAVEREHYASQLQAQLVTDDGPERDEIVAEDATTAAAVAEEPYLDPTTIHRTMLLAQHTADTVIDDAQREAAEILTVANGQAADLVEGAIEEARALEAAVAASTQAELDAHQARLSAIQDQIARLDRFSDDYRSHLHAVIVEHLERLDEPIGEPDGRIEISSVDALNGDGVVEAHGASEDVAAAASSTGLDAPEAPEALHSLGSPDTPGSPDSLEAETAPATSLGTAQDALVASGEEVSTFDATDPQGLAIAGVDDLAMPSDDALTETITAPLAEASEAAAAGSGDVGDEAAASTGPSGGNSTDPASQVLQAAVRDAAHGESDASGDLLSEERIADILRTARAEAGGVYLDRPDESAGTGDLPL